MIRVTTNSTLHMYQSNLMQSSNQLYSAMEKLMTGRNFDSYAERRQCPSCQQRNCPE